MILGRGGHAPAFDDLAAIEIEGIKFFLEVLSERAKSLFGFAALLGASDPDRLIFTEFLENSVGHEPFP